MPLIINPIEQQVQLPLEKKPGTDPTNKDVFSDVFMLINVIRVILIALNSTFAAIVAYVNGIPSEAPADGNTYGRKNGVWVALTSYFCARFFSDSTAATSTTLFASKGLLIKPRQSVTITSLHALVAAAATTNTYAIDIVRVASATISADGITCTAVGAIDQLTYVGTASAVGSTARKYIRIALGTPVTLASGSYYLIVVRNTTATGTTAVIPITLGSSLGQPFLSAPVDSYIGMPYYNTTTLSLTQAATGIVASRYLFAGFEGTFVS